MSAELIKRWIQAVKPFDIDEVMSSMTDQYAKAFGWDQGTAASAKRAMLSVDKVKLMEQVTMFAEEHFSEEALVKAVEFFESPMGARYLAQRRIVSVGAQTIIVKGISDGIKREFGI